MTVADQFSKSAHFVALPKVTSVLETAQQLTNHVFALHGIPEDIVWDHGPQLTSQVWKELCSPLEEKVSLSSGYHRATDKRSTPVRS